MKDYWIDVQVDEHIYIGTWTAKNKASAIKQVMDFYRERTEKVCKIIKIREAK